MNHMVSLSVGVLSEEDRHRVYQDFSELASSLGNTHEYVAVSSTNCEELTYEPESDSENLYYDDNTLNKVNAAINKAIRNRVYLIASEKGVPSEDFAENIINELLNAGIVFRECRKESSDV